MKNRYKNYKNVFVQFISVYSFENGLTYTT